MRTLGLLLGSALLLIPLAAGPVSVRAEGVPHDVDLIPTERAAWTPKNVAIGVTSVLGGWKYWYEDRVIDVQTAPAEAALSLTCARTCSSSAESPARVTPREST
jgi:hypothetical protein